MKAFSLKSVRVKHRNARSDVLASAQSGQLNQFRRPFGSVGNYRRFSRASFHKAERTQTYIRTRSDRGTIVNERAQRCTRANVYTERNNVYVRNYMNQLKSPHYVC